MKRGAWKKIYSILLAVLMVISMAGTYKPTEVQAKQPENVVVRVDTGDVTMVKRGDIVDITVSLSGNGTSELENPDRLDQIWGLQVVFDYDTDVFTAEGDAVKGNVITSAGTFTDLYTNTETGTVRAVAALLANEDTYSPCIENGEIFSISLRVKDDAPAGASSFSLDGTEFTDGTLEVNTIPYSTGGGLSLYVEVPAEGISLNESEIDLEKGEEQTLTATVEPEDSTDSVTWSSSDDSVAVVENGVVTAVGTGTATVTAVAGDYSAECQVNVTNPLKSITISAEDDKTAVTKGETLQLSVAYDPEDTTDTKSVSWSSDKPDVASVDENGLVTAVSDGAAVITAETPGGIKDTYEITVAEIHLQSISIEETVTIAKGESETLTITYDPENTTDDRTAVWESDDTDIAVVDKNGKVTAIAPGVANITASVGDKTDSCVVTVVSPMTGIKADPSSVEVVKNQSTELSYTVVPEDTTDSVKSVEYESSNISVATVDTDGTVTGKKAGTTEITIKVTSSADEVFTDTVEVTVTEIPINKVILDKTNVTVEKGETAELTASIEPKDTTDDDKAVRWSSSDPSIVTVSADADNSYHAVITASSEKGGYATVTATAANGTKASCEVFVPIHITSISLPKEVTINKGEGQALSLTILPADTTDSKTAEWKSSNEDVAIVDSNGNVTALAVGEAEITATIGEFTAVTKVTVAAPLKNIIITSDAVLTLYKNETSQVTYTLDPEDTTDSKNVTFRTSDASIASVSQDGLIQANGEGTAVITLSGANQVSAEVTVNVIEIPISQIILSQTEATIEKGGTLTLTATVEPENNTDDDQGITWSSSDDTIASVDASGVVTATQKGGKVTITVASAARPGVKSTCTIIVPIHMESISLPETMTMNRGEKTTPVLTIEPSNTTDDKTVTWTSSNPEVAAVDASTGEITALKEGTTEIKVSTTKTAEILSDTMTVSVSEKHATEDTLGKVVITVPKEPLLKGATLDLNTLINLDKVFHENGITDTAKIIWSSSNPDIASVDEKGILLGVKEGETVITAAITVTDGSGNVSEYTKEAALTVKEIHLESVVFDKEISEMKVGDSAELKIVLKPSNTTDDIVTTWSSSDEKIVSVKDGVLTANTVGTATITASVNGKTVSVTISVVPASSGGTETETGGSSSNQGSGSTSGGSSGETASNTVDSPHTGDTTLIAPYIILLIGAAAAVFYTVRRIRKTK